MGPTYNTPSNARMAAAKSKLAMFGRESVMDIVALVNFRGVGIISDIFDSETSSPPRPFFVLEPSITPPEDQEMLISGLMTILMGYIRQPQLDTTAYKNILMNAYSLPEAWAQSIAEGIDTKDVLRPVSSESGLVDKALSALENRLDAFRDSWNSVLKAGGLDDSFLFWNQSQGYDRDMLYEIFSLGEQVQKMQRRGRLMVAQSKAMAGGAFLTGDVSGYGIGDVQLADQAMGDPDFSNKVVIGDAIRALSLSKVPRTAMGDMAGLVSKAGTTHVRNLKRLASSANVDCDAPAFSGPAPVEQGDLASTLIAALTGNMPGLLKSGGAAVSRLGIMGSGDVTMGDALSAYIDAEHGDVDDGDIDNDDEGVGTGGIRRGINRMRQNVKTRRAGRTKVANAKDARSRNRINSRFDDRLAGINGPAEVDPNDDFPSGNDNPDDAAASQGNSDFEEFN